MKQISILNVIIYLLFFLIRLNKISSLNLTIIHTNDFHARFTPTNVYSSECSKTDLANNKCYAGVARLVAKANEIRNSTDNLLFLNAGDNFVGTVLYQIYKYKIVADFIPLIKYDAMALGNHEFDDGVANLAPYINAINEISPTICANIDLSKVPSLQKIKKSQIFLRDGKKIGVIGYTTPESMYISSPGPNIMIDDEIPAIREEALRLKNENQVDIIMALGHSGYDKDVEIGRKIPEIDIVIGGHSNTFLYNGEPPSIEKPADSYPYVITHDDGNKTLVITAYAYGKYLGYLNVVFDDDGRVTEYNGNPILLDNTVAEDPVAKQLLNTRMDQIKNLFTDVIGKTQVFLEGETGACRAKECNLGNVIADSFVHALLPSNNIVTQSSGWTKNPVAFLPGGSIRASIDASQTAGNITLQNLLTTMPFQNTLTVASLTGEQLKKVFEHSVSGFEKGSVALQGRFLQVSGIHVVYDLNQPKGQRVKSLKIRCGTDCKIPKYIAANDTLIYNVIITSYISDGGDGYAVLKDKSILKEQLEIQDFDAVKSYFQVNRLITTGVEERINFL